MVHNREIAAARNDALETRADLRRQRIASHVDIAQIEEQLRKIARTPHRNPRRTAVEVGMNSYARAPD